MLLIASSNGRTNQRKSTLSPIQLAVVLAVRPVRLFVRNVVSVACSRFWGGGCQTYMVEEPHRLLSSVGHILVPDDYSNQRSHADF